MAKVAFIGLGVMGYPDGRASGRERPRRLTVYNRTADKAENGWRARRRAAADAGEAAEGAEIVFAASAMTTTCAR